MNNCENNSTNVTFDPGWNDPPKFSYSPQQTTVNKPRNFLNKRVAFPLSGDSSPSVSSAQNLPTPLVNLPSAVAVQFSKNIQLPNDPIDSEAILKEVKDILLFILDNCTELNSKSNDIKRRISVMEDMWLSGKLTDRIKMQMKDLCLALQDDQPNIADEIHRALMVDHVSSVSSWMPGVKQLIYHCIARSELFAIDKESGSIGQ